MPADGTIAAASQTRTELGTTHSRSGSPYRLRRQVCADNSIRAWHECECKNAGTPSAGIVPDQSTLMPAALMIGHHLSISAF